MRSLFGVWKAIAFGVVEGDRFLGCGGAIAVLGDVGRAIAFGDVGGAIAFWMREGDRFDNEGFGGAIALLFPP